MEGDAPSSPGGVYVEQFLRLYYDDALPIV